MSELPGFVHFEAEEKIGRYLVFEKLVEGDMDAVYKAMDPVLHRFLSVKVFKDAAQASKEQIDAFLKAIRELAALSHRYVVPIYDMGRISRYIYVATGYIEGYTMADYIRDDRIYSGKMARRFVEEVCAALQYAQQMNFLHLDLTPNNILVDWNHNLSVANLGLNQCRNFLLDKPAYEILNIPAYAAPEHIQGGEMTYQTDMYSLGAVLFHLMTGERVYAGHTPEEVFHAHLHEPFPTDRALDLKIPLPWIDMLSRLMEKDPAKRYDSYRDIIDHAIAIEPF